MNQQLQGWRLINAAARPSRRTLVPLNCHNPGDGAPRLSFAGGSQSHPEQLGTGRDQRLLLPHTDHQVTVALCRTPAKHSASKPEQVLPQRPIDGREVLPHNLHPPRAGARSTLPQLNSRSWRTPADSASWLRLQELLCQPRTT